MEKNRSFDTWKFRKFKRKFWYHCFGCQWAGVWVSTKHGRFTVRSLELVSVDKFPEYSGESGKSEKKEGKSGKPEGRLVQTHPQIFTYSRCPGARSKTQGAEESSLHKTINNFIPFCLPLSVSSPINLPFTIVRSFVTAKQSFDCAFRSPSHRWTKHSWNDFGKRSFPNEAE